MTLVNIRAGGRSANLEGDQSVISQNVGGGGKFPPDQTGSSGPEHREIAMKISLISMKNFNRNFATYHCNKVVRNVTCD